uniref:Uncharacterized protein n=1 Tax=Arcella intermedia TaxID=1963864 RepID=A0A6B2LCC7_9EUKA
MVTGTSSGIGRHAAIELAKLNYTVYCTVRTKEDMHRWAQESRSLRLEKYIIPMAIEITNSTQIQEGRKEIEEYLTKTGKPLVGIVNNAGVSFRKPVEMQEMDKVRKLFDVNFFGAVETTQAFLPLLRKHKGRVVFISSMSAYGSLYGSGFYSASKRAIEAIADVLRVELAEHEVSVSSILPGHIDTDLKEKGADNWTGEEHPAYPGIREKIMTAREENFKAAPGPEVTSEVVIHSLTSPYPQTRYYVGNAYQYPIQLVPVILGVLPDRVADFLKANKF